MTPIEAMKQAQETGQIAITKNTAMAFEHLLEWQDHYAKLVDVLTSLYDTDTGAAMIEDFNKQYQVLRDALVSQLNYNISVESLGTLDFKGL